MYDLYRAMIVEYGLKMLKSNQVSGSSGNLSVKISENLIAISPSGIPYDELLPEQVPVIDLNGKIVDGSYKPSIEHKLHTEIYKSFPEVDAVIHTHSIYASVLSTLRISLPAITETVLMISEEIPIASYANAGTFELARNVVEAMKKSRAVLMANHGLVCAAKTMKEAFSMCENVERNAQVYVLALSTGKMVHTIDEAHAKEAMEFLRKNYGQTT
ncbi:class II aldolase/adducin family protein [Pseudothermotoga sp. U03pept]|uniref:class II aldolase/adducin family protein n=1 Tax=Pseudothermotoga sp. U03pept TaxID=3447012 RepID=UPI003F09EC3F